jgi:hypothetical protein
MSPRRILLALFAVLAAACAPSTDAGYQAALRDHVWKYYVQGDGRADVIACIGDHFPQSPHAIEMSAFTHNQDFGEVSAIFRMPSERSVYAVGETPVYVVRATMAASAPMSVAPNVSTVRSCCPLDAESQLCQPAPSEPGATEPLP